MNEQIGSGSNATIDSTFNESCTSLTRILKDKKKYTGKRRRSSMKQAVNLVEKNSQKLLLNKAQLESLPPSEKNSMQVFSQTVNYIIIVYIICFIPNTIYETIKIVYPWILQLELFQQGLRANRLGWIFLNFYFCNSICDPIIYVLLNKKVKSNRAIFVAVLFIFVPKNYYLVTHLLERKILGNCKSGKKPVWNLGDSFRKKRSDFRTVKRSCSERLKGSRYRRKRVVIDELEMDKNEIHFQTVSRNNRKQSHFRNVRNQTVINQNITYHNVTNQHFTCLNFSSNGERINLKKTASNGPKPIKTSWMGLLKKWSEQNLSILWPNVMISESMPVFHEEMIRSGNSGIYDDRTFAAFEARYRPSLESRSCSCFDFPTHDIDRTSECGNGCGAIAMGFAREIAKNCELPGRESERGYDLPAIYTETSMLPSICSGNTIWKSDFDAIDE